MDTAQVESLISTLKDYSLSYGINILLSIVLLIIGLKVISIVGNAFEKTLLKKDIEKSLAHFLSSLMSWVLKIALILSCIKTIGFETTSFIAILGSAGLAVGLALQGSLSNFAGGVLILLLKPFKVGDFIKAQGHMGTVEKITTFYTELKTPDNQVIYIPNGGLANTSVINVNAKDTRRVDFVFGIGYDDNIDLAKKIINDRFDNDSRVLKDPAINIILGELADSSVNIFARAWVKTEDYWGFYWETLEVVKKDFDEKGISIPFPQRDVHIHNEK